MKKDDFRTKPVREVLGQLPLNLRLALRAIPIETLASSSPQADRLGAEHIARIFVLHGGRLRIQR